MIYQIYNGPRVFTLSDARALLPTIIKITEKTNAKVKALVQRIEMIRHSDPNAVPDLENQINAEVSAWQNKCNALGAHGKGLWLVDFDSGSGFYCWKFPETNLDHFHSYTEGFQARKKVTENAS